MQEGWRGEEAGENLRLSTVSAGVGGVVAVLVKVLGGGEVEREGDCGHRTNEGMPLNNNFTICAHICDEGCDSHILDHIHFTLRAGFPTNCLPQRSLR